jgi:hypothetical protein
MAHSTLAVFPVSHFPQSIFDISRIVRLIDEAAGGALFTFCSHESAKSTYGACDGVPCPAKATVYDTQTEQEYCAKHFREVSRG